MSESQTPSPIESSLTTVSAAEWLALAQKKSPEGRRELFRTLEGLLVENGHSGRERTLAGEILRHLIGGMETALRKSLADKLAARADAPHALIVELANDEIEIAQPVLINSEVLRDRDLIAIIEHRTIEHQLAVTCRKTLSAAVAKALVETRNRDVIVGLINNHGAKISKSVIAYLADEAERIDQYQMPLLRRSDLPADLALRIYGYISAELRRHAVARHGVDPGAVDDALEAATAEAMDRHRPEETTTSPAEALADRLVDNETATGGFLVDVLAGGDLALFEALLAKLTGLRTKTVATMIFESGGRALIILCRAAGLDAETVRQVVRLMGLADGAALEGEDALIDLFEKTGRESAERIVARWKRSRSRARAMSEISLAPGLDPITDSRRLT